MLELQKQEENKKDIVRQNEKEQIQTKLSEYQNQLKSINESIERKQSKIQEKKMQIEELSDSFQRCNQSSLQPIKYNPLTYQQQPPQVALSKIPTYNQSEENKQEVFNATSQSSQNYNKFDYNLQSQNLPFYQQKNNQTIQQSNVESNKQQNQSSLLNNQQPNEIKKIQCIYLHDQMTQVNQIEGIKYYSLKIKTEGYFGYQTLVCESLIQELLQFFADKNIQQQTHVILHFSKVNQEKQFENITSSIYSLIAKLKKIDIPFITIIQGQNQKFNQYLKDLIKKHFQSVQISINEETSHEILNATSQSQSYNKSDYNQQIQNLSSQQKDTKKINRIYLYDQLIKIEPIQGIQYYPLKISTETSLLFKKSLVCQNLIQELINFFDKTNIQQYTHVILHFSKVNQEKNFQDITSSIYSLIARLQKINMLFITIIQGQNEKFNQYLSDLIKKHIPSIQIKIEQQINQNVLSFIPEFRNQQIIQDTKQQQQEIIKIQQQQQQDLQKLQRGYEIHTQQEQQIQVEKNQYNQQQLQQNKLKQQQQLYMEEIKVLDKEIQTKKNELLDLELEISKQKSLLKIEDLKPKSIKSIQIQFQQIQDVLDSIDFNFNISQYLSCLNQKEIELRKLEKSVQKILLSIQFNSSGLIIKLSEQISIKHPQSYGDLLKEMSQTLVGNQKSIDQFKFLRIQIFLDLEPIKRDVCTSEMETLIKAIKMQLNQELRNYFNDLLDQLAQESSQYQTSQLMSKLLQSF